MNVTGITTFSDRINVVSGVSTFQDDAKLTFGAQTDLLIQHDGTDTEIYNKTGNLKIRANDLDIQDYTNGHSMITADRDGSVDLFYDNYNALQTTPQGINVSGVTTSNRLLISGISTFTGLIDANGGAHIDNLRLGINDDSEISTSAGDLRLDSAGGTVQVNDNLSVSGTITGNGSGLTTLNADRLTDGTVPLARLGSGTKNSSTFLAGDNTFRTVVVAINDFNPSNSAGNNRLVISNGGSSVRCDSDLTFDGTSLHVHGGANQIVCDGNIVAFNSDIRLKTAIQPIENAVAKTLKLNGFTYEHNEVAESIGYKLDGERFAGVSAQDVQSVLPEAVKPAPADPNYLTVQYEKIVPLLIEAIKELKAEIDELKK